MTRRKVRRTAARVLEKAEISTPPVDVYDLASSVAHVVDKEMDPDISGMLIPIEPKVDGKEWAILVNQDHPPVRRRFTVAHELGHLLMHGYSTAHADSGYKVRFRDPRSSEGSVREEIEANQFAAEILMPEDVLLDRLAEEDLEYVSLHEDENNSVLRRIAREFDVSQEALSIRISSLLA